MYIFRKVKKSFSVVAISFILMAVFSVLRLSAGYRYVPSNGVNSPETTESSAVHDTDNPAQIGEEIPAETEIPEPAKPIPEETTAKKHQEEYVTQCSSYIDCTAYSYILEGKTASGIYTKFNTI